MTVLLVLYGGKLLCADTPDVACDSGIISETFGAAVSKRHDGKGFCYEL